VGVGRADLDGDGLANDLYLDGIYFEDLSGAQDATGVEPMLLRTRSGASYSYTREAMARARGLRPCRWATPCSVTKQW
jgi:hypothetical protein